MKRFSARTPRGSIVGRKFLILALSLGILLSVLFVSTQTAISEFWYSPFPNISSWLGFGGRPGGLHPSGGEYVVIGWNDLGMHCINPTFKDLAILPPYNNLWAQVIKRGDPPKVVTSGISLEYSFINNKTVVGKTDFWQYARQLFGVTLPL